MHIQKLSLEQFRGSQALTLELHEKMNVFFGMNGAGKSSVLDASAILLSWLVNRIKKAGTSGRPITELDIMNHASSALLNITINDDGNAFVWSLAKVRARYHKQDVSSKLTELTELSKKLQDQVTESAGKVNIPLFVYYPVNRAVVDIPLRIRNRHPFDLLSAFDDALTSGANFRTFFEWFREREDLENEHRSYTLDSDFGSGRSEDFLYPDPQLEAVRHALTQLMPDFSNLTIRRSPLRMEVKKNHEWLAVDQLSDGEKCLMAMVGDLARRMSIANPVLGNPLEGEGVVMIDEIDLHLHPKWQRLIVPKLTEVFPNCQFIITTHSPHVITHVQRDSLFLLSNTKNGLEVSHPIESYGKTTERILEDLMGLETTRPNEVRSALQGIYARIDSGDYANAKAAINELESRIGEDPELVKATVLIKRKALIGK